MIKNILFIFLLLLLYFFILKHHKENFLSKGKVLTFPKPNNWNKMKFKDKLKIYGSNLPKEYSLYADKYRVKSYIKNLNIHGLYIPKTIKVLDINKKVLDLNSLPKNCVIKTNNGSGDIIIIKNKKIILMIKRGIKIKNNLENFKEWVERCTQPHQTKYEKHYNLIKPVVFVEEFLDDNIKDYKFFCFHGKVKFCQIDGNRFIGHCRNFYDKNFNLLTFTFKTNNCKFNIKKPKKYKKMINIAEKISNLFEFARIDLYEINNKIYFGEITFLPEAGIREFKPLKYEYTIGNYWY